MLLDVRPVFTSVAQGVHCACQVFSAINHTLASVFPTVVPYAQHLPSFADCWVRAPHMTMMLCAFLCICRRTLVWMLSVCW